MVCSGARIGTADGWAERAAQRARVRAPPRSSAGSAARWFAPGLPRARARRPGRARARALLVDVDDESYARCCEALGAFDRTVAACRRSPCPTARRQRRARRRHDDRRRCSDARRRGAGWAASSSSPARAHLAVARRAREAAALIAEHVRSTDAVGRARDVPRATRRRADPRPRHGRAPRRARRRPRRRRHRRDHRRDRAVPGLHHALRLGRDLGAARPVAPRALDRHAREPRRPAATRPRSRMHVRAALRNGLTPRRDRRGHPAHRPLRRPAGGERRARRSRARCSPSEPDADEPDPESDPDATRRPMDKTVRERGRGRRRHSGRGVARRRRLRPVGRADRADPRPARARASATSRWSRTTAASTAGGWASCSRPAASARVIASLHRREQGVRPPVPRRRGRGRADAAGHARRAAPRGRRRHPGVLHGDGRGHRGLRRRHAAALRGRRLRGARERPEGAAPVRRVRPHPRVRARAGDPHRLRARAGRGRRPARQPAVREVRRATSTRSPAWPVASRSPRSTSSSSRACSIPTTSTCPGSTSTGSSC